MRTGSIVCWLAILLCVQAAHAQSALRYAKADERQALRRVARELTGTIVYARPPMETRGELGWMIEAMQIGVWEPTTLGPGACARFSADGQKLALFLPDQSTLEQKNHGEIWMMGVDGSEPVRLCDGAWSIAPRGACPIDFHPNMRSIWFIGQGGRLMAVDTRTGKVTPTGMPGRFEGEFQLSGDGRYLVGRLQGQGDWAMNRRLVRIDTRSGLQRIYGAGCGASLSPDGRWMTANHEGHYLLSIWFRDLARQAELRAKDLVRPQDGWHRLHWSNHNDWLAFSSEVYQKVGRPYSGPADAFLLQPSTREAIRVTFRQEAAFPDLYISKKRKTGLSVPPLGGPPIQPARMQSKRADPARIFRTHGDTIADPGPATHIPRIKVRAKLLSMAPLDKISARRAGACLREGLWEVRSAERGELRDIQVVVVHWAARKGHLDKGAFARRIGGTYTLSLEPWHMHPELKSVARSIGRSDKDSHPPRFLALD